MPPKIPKKRKGEATSTGSRKKRATRSVAHHASSDPVADDGGIIEDSSSAAIGAILPVLCELPAISLASSSATPNLNRWKKVTAQPDKLRVQPMRFDASWARAVAQKARESIQRRKKLISSDMEVVELQHAKVYDGRDFIVDRVELHPAEKTSLGVWSIFVRDSNRMDGNVFELYGLDDSRGPGAPQGPLSSQICRDEGAARELGRHACTLMNRLPFTIEGYLNLKRLPGSQRPPLRIVEVLALDLWQPPRFNYSQMHPSYYDSSHAAFSSIPFRQNGGARTQTGNNDRIPVSMLLLVEHFQASDLNIRQPFNLSRRTIDYEKLHTVNEIPSDFIHYPEKIIFEHPDLSEDQKAGIRRLIRNTFYQLHGRFGGFKQMYYYLDSLLQPFAPRPPRRTYNDEAWATWARENPQAQVRLFDGKSFYSVSDAQSRFVFRQITPSDTAKASAPALGGQKIHIVSNSRCELAYVLSEMIFVLSHGGNALEAWQAGVVAAEVTAARLLSTDNMLSAMCWCSDDAASACNLHICAMCWDMRLCDDLVALIDGRRVCEACCDEAGDCVDSEVLNAFKASKAATAATTSKGSKGTTAVKASKASKASKGSKAATVATAPSASMEVLKTLNGMTANLLTPDVRKAAREKLVKTTEQVTRGRRAINPLQLSLDAVTPLAMVGGRLYHHHPENIALTTYAVNNVKHTWPASILPVFRAAAQQTLEESRTQTRDLAFWAKINNAFDHVHHISIQLSTWKKSRLSYQISEGQLRTLSDAWKTGRWSDNLLKVRAAIGQRTVPATGAEDCSATTLQEFVEGERVRAPQDYRKDSWYEGESVDRGEIRRRCAKWTAEVIEQIRSIVLQLEQSYSLEIPRTRDGAPWPFRRDHMLTDERDTWEWWYYEATNRYLRMMIRCNWAHETNESPVTILLEILVQWFERNGGVDDFIHTEMTVWVRHPACYSIGRAGNIQPGSPMTTGWTRPFPTQYAQDYDRQRRTVVVQPQFVNFLWKDHDPDTHPLLLQIIAELSPHTAHFDALDMDLPSMQYPTESRISRRKRVEVEGLEDDGNDLDGVHGELDDVDEAGFSHDQISAIEPEGPNDKDAAPRKASSHEAAAQQTLQHQIAELTRQLALVPLTEERRGTMQTMLARLSEAASTGDRALFTERREEYARMLKSSTAATSNCICCDQPVQPDDMVRCSGQHANTVVMHLACRVLSTKPQYGQPVFCLDCSRGSQALSGLPTNMPNLGSTCYMSGSIQILFHLEAFRNIVLNVSRPAKPTDESGRHPTSWITAGYNPPAGINAAERLQFNQTSMSTHVVNAERLAGQLKAFFMRLRETEIGVLPGSEVRSILGAVSTYNREFQNRSNDAGTLLLSLIECLMLVTDSSTPEGRYRTEEVADQLTEWQHLGQHAPLEEYSDALFEAWLGEGRRTEVAQIFGSQVVIEWNCFLCRAAKRRAEHQSHLELTIAETRTQESIELSELLRDFATQQLAEGQPCPSMEDDHPPCLMLYRRITVAPPVLVLTFARAGYYGRIRTEFINIPEFLDISSIGDDVRLPSEGEGHRSLGNQNIYRLFAVDMYYRSPPHYIPYVRRGDRWVCMNDSASPGGVFAEHPQVATADGGIPFYVVYTREDARSELPRDQDGNRTARFTITKRGNNPGPEVRVYPSPESRFRCPGGGGHQCDSTFDTQAAANAHVETFIDDTDDLGADLSVMCEKCKQTFGSQDILDNHQCPATRVTCKECKQTFASEEVLGRHQCPAATCDRCNQTFDSQEQLSQHTCPVARNKFSCRLCYEKFETDEALGEHVGTTHARASTSTVEKQEEQLRQTLAKVSHDVVTEARARFDEMLHHFQGLDEQRLQNHLQAVEGVYQERLGDLETAHENTIREREQMIKDDEAAHRQRMQDDEAAHRQRMQDEEAAHRQRMQDDEAAHRQRMQDDEDAHGRKMRDAEAVHTRTLQEIGDRQIQEAGRRYEAELQERERNHTESVQQSVMGGVRDSLLKIAQGIDEEMKGQKKE